ncbi:MAG: hypothetical protein BVN35_14490 [Proteobacteria bacterium ST_bin11]|nr:MAG: hypothetical protein BVN35_14490 [Proteobacteria bacterium ST_bin11]
MHPEFLRIIVVEMEGRERGRNGVSFFFRKMSLKKNFSFIFLVVVLLAELAFASFKDNNLLIESVCVGGAKRHQADIDADRASWNTVPFKRSDIINYMKLGFDTNNNSALDFEECENARNEYLNEAERQIVESCETIFIKCDCDGDGKITQEDFENAYMTCLKDATAGTLIKKLIGDRMDGLAFQGRKDTPTVDIPEGQRQQKKPPTKKH